MSKRWIGEREWNEEEDENENENEEEAEAEEEEDRIDRSTG